MGRQIFLKSFRKRAHRGPKSDFLAGMKLDIILQRRAGRVGTIQPWVRSMLNRFFGHPKNLALNAIFFNDNFSRQAQAHAPNDSTPKQKITDHPREKKSLIWHPKVGGWRSAYPARTRLQLAKLANRPSMWSKFGTPVISTNFTNFANHIFFTKV